MEFVGKAIEVTQLSMTYYSVLEFVKNKVRVELYFFCNEECNAYQQRYLSRSFLCIVCICWRASPWTPTSTRPAITWTALAPIWPPFTARTIWQTWSVLFSLSRQNRTQNQQNRIHASKYISMRAQGFLLLVQYQQSWTVPVLRNRQGKFYSTDGNATEKRYNLLRWTQCRHQDICDIYWSFR